MKAPCKGCKFRAIGCHSTCAAYIKYSLSRKEELETRNIRSCVCGYIRQITTASSGLKVNIRG